VLGLRFHEINVQRRNYNNSPRMFASATPRLTGKRRNNRGMAQKNGPELQKFSLTAQERSRIELFACNKPFYFKEIRWRPEVTLVTRAWHEPCIYQIVQFGQL
jgi:hypothetical protein